MFDLRHFSHNQDFKLRILILLQNILQNIETLFLEHLSGGTLIKVENNLIK